MNDVTMKSSVVGGGNSSYNIIRHMSYKIYNDVILTGTLNGNISSSSFKWNRNNWYVNLQNNSSDSCFVLGSGGGQYNLDKNSTSYLTPYGTRLIIEYKE